MKEGKKERKRMRWWREEQGKKMYTNKGRNKQQKGEGRIKKNKKEYEK